MAWGVEYTHEFEEWWDELSMAEQDSVSVVVDLLVGFGTDLGSPYSSKIMESKLSHMRELRIQHGGSPYRVLYAFDPRRMAILLIGGNKTGQDRWYEVFVPKAEKIYIEHLKTLEKEKKNG